MLADVDRQALGARIRAGRLAMNLTQEQLAELLDVTTQYIGNLERGKAYPSIRMFVSLCYALYLDPNALLADSLPEERFASPSSCKLRSCANVYAHSLTGYLEIWWAHSGIADFEAFAGLPINELPLSCIMDVREDESSFLSL